MNENYDLKGSVWKLQQRRPWKFGLTHLVNLESFDVEFSPLGKALERTEYTNGDAIYRSARFAYDDQGRILRAAEFDGTGVETAISRYDYSDGRRHCTTRNSAGNIIGRSINEYDNDLLTIMGTYDASGQPKRLKTFEYSGGKLAKAVSKYFGPDATLIETSITRFDSLGRVVEAFGLKPDGKPAGDGRYTYEYNDEGQLHRILSYNDLADPEIPNAVSGFLYKCDERGNWIERIRFHRFRGDSDWTKSVTTRSITYYPTGSV